MSSSPIIIGLTGNIGVGKSAALDALRRLGARVIDADKVAHQVMTPGSLAYEDVVEAFGPDILAADGSIDRHKLAAIVFADAGQLARLESIVHPAVERAIKDEIDRAREPVVVIEAIKLLEGRLRSLCDKTWVISASEQTQLARLMQQRGMSEAEARRRMAAQSPQSWKEQQADVVIRNDGSLEDLATQVARAWRGITDRRPRTEGRKNSDSPSSPPPTKLS